MHGMTSRKSSYSASHTFTHRSDFPYATTMKVAASSHTQLSYLTDYQIIQCRSLVYGLWVISMSSTWCDRRTREVRKSWCTTTAMSSTARLTYPIANQSGALCSEYLLEPSGRVTRKGECQTMHSRGAQREGREMLTLPARSVTAALGVIIMTYM